MDWQKVVTDLFNKAQNPAATDEERIAFSEKATYLMAKYGVQELLDLNTSTPPNAESLYIQKSKYNVQRAQLAWGIAPAMGCKAIRLRDGRIHVFGLPNDLKRFTHLYTSLWIQALLGLAASEQPAFVHGKTHSHSYLLGFIHEVSSRVSAAARRAEQEHTTSAPSTALVLANRTQIVKDAYHAIYPRLVDAHTTSARNLDSYNAGVSSGARADIGQSRVGTNSSTRRSLGV